METLITEDADEKIVWDRTERALAFLDTCPTPGTLTITAFVRLYKHGSRDLSYKHGGQ